MKAILGSFLVTGLLLCSGCSHHGDSAHRSKAPWGTIAGEEVSIYTLRNSAGMEARISNYGGILLSLSVPDLAGKSDDIVLGYDSLASYRRDKSALGALLGRYGNSIDGAKFLLDGMPYAIRPSDSSRRVSPGGRQFATAVWSVDESTPATQAMVAMSFVSQDGSEGYPGTLNVRVVYALTDSNTLAIECTATTDKPTIVNIVPRFVFNLAGARAGTILAHELQINSNWFTPIDSFGIPTGALRSVIGTPMDFRLPTAIGNCLAMSDDQLHFGEGFDHNWALTTSGQELVHAATVAERSSGRVMEVWTTAPGLHFSSSPRCDTLGGADHRVREGFSLTPQYYPDSPNKPQFPPVTLRPGSSYRVRTEYRFHTR